MFDLLLFNLRNQGVTVGVGEWLTFMEALKKEIITDLEGLYQVGRSLLVTSEAHYDSWDLAFEATFAGVELPPEQTASLAEWLRSHLTGEGESVDLGMTPDELWKLFEERLREQKERHDGGNHWIGTGGASPFGQGGRSRGGLRVGEGARGHRSALAGMRRWAPYRTDRKLAPGQLEVRDFQVALKALRSLVRDGELEVDLKGTIRKTADNGGDIEVVEQRAKRNRMHLVLIMDSGGSMDPHTLLVEKLFRAANKMKGFKSFSAYFFHNVPYGMLTRMQDGREERVPIPRLLNEWTQAHRLVFVGDASMAPYELFASMGNSRWQDSSGRERSSGLDWLKMIRRSCPASIWMNPDPMRWWDHQTVAAIGQVYPMFPLTVDGLRDGIRELRKMES